MSGSSITDCEESADPDLTFGPISINVFGRAFPDDKHALDRDALTCSVTVQTHDISARLTDGCIYGFGLLGFLQSLERLYETLSGEAVLDASDLGLTLRLKALGLGHVAVQSQFYSPSCAGTSWEMTMDHESDQSFLPKIIGQCRVLLRRYPVQFIPTPPKSVATQQQE